jgi:hypothetical protein
MAAPLTYSGPLPAEVSPFYIERGWRCRCARFDFIDPPGLVTRHVDAADGSMHTATGCSRPVHLRRLFDMVAIDEV